jgi:hypothetical protein
MKACMESSRRVVSEQHSAADLRAQVPAVPGKTCPGGNL